MSEPQNAKYIVFLHKELAKWGYPIGLTPV